MSGNPQKLKLLYLLKLLNEETDEDHGVTMNRICEYLAEQGVPAERKSVYRDIATLREFGIDVCVHHKLPDEYSLGSRLLSLQEVMLMVDAVQSSPFMTKRASDRITRALKTLVSKDDRRRLDKSVHVHRRVKSQNDSVLGTVDKIQEAITRRRQIRFRYFSYDGTKAKVLRREGRFYEETPLYVVFSDGHYYMVAYNEHHDSFPHYRIDRMVDVAVSDKARVRNAAASSYDIRALEGQAFGMYSGEPISTTLLVNESVMDVIIDRFGKEVFTTKLSNGLVRVHVTVMESPVFFGWLAMLGDKVTIEIPRRLAQAYQEYLKKILQAYEPKPKDFPPLSWPKE